MNILLVLPALICLLTGIGLLVSSFADHRKAKDWFGRKLSPEENRRVHILANGVMILTAAVTLWTVWTQNYTIEIASFLDQLPIYFHSDNISRIFLTITSMVWIAVGIYSCKYMQHEGNEKRFFGFLMIAYSVLVFLNLSGNLITFYLFYELMTLSSMPLVLHDGTREAIMAAMKYMLYSLAGAYCALFGLYFLYQYCDTLTFVAGGSLQTETAAKHPFIILCAIFLMMVGFGAKAGMLPLHSWLPAAHPVAPAPASAALSSIIVKCGILGMIRVIYFIAGPDFIRGTWVQTLWMTLSLMTVFMGSLLAFREKVFKKRLAYSTVSQVSYIIFGLSVLDETALTGSLLHVVFHALIKCTLFCSAGIFIFRTGKTRVDEYSGIGKKMPLTLWCYTFAALALVGIPPMSGFISKWYLAIGALSSDTGVFRFAGPAVLLVSALLTAGYLLPISIKGFLPGEEDTAVRQKEKVDLMSLIPLVFAFLIVMLGLFPNPLIDFMRSIASQLV